MATEVSTIFRTLDWAERRPALAQAVMAIAYGLGHFRQWRSIV